MSQYELQEVGISLYCVGEWIATEGGTRDLGPQTIAIVKKDHPDGFQTSYEGSPVHAAAWDKAMPELLKAIKSRRLRVEGLRNGDTRKAWEEIEPREFSDTYNNPFRQTSLTLILSDCRRLTLWPDKATIEDGRGCIYWSDIRACSRDEVLALWPPARGFEGALIQAANQNGGTVSQKIAEEIARKIGVSISREESRDMLKRLGIAGKQGRKKNTL